MTKQPLLEAKSLSKNFVNVRAVHNLSFQIGAGEIYGFIGPNGSGKTTTLRILAGLESPTSGDALIMQHSVVEDPEKISGCVGFMPDKFLPYANMEVVEFLEFFAHAQALSFEKKWERIQTVITLCGLEDFKTRRVDALSKGMEQRLHLAKILLHDPQVLLLDEPANGLDPRARVEFRDLLRTLANQGKAILISSHILSELSEICHGVIVLEKGDEVFSGSIDQIREELAENKQIQLEFLSSAATLAALLAKNSLVKNLRMGQQTAQFEFLGTAQELAALHKQLVMAGVEVSSFHETKINLEEIFLQKTKGNLQ